MNNIPYNKLIYLFWLFIYYIKFRLPIAYIDTEAVKMDKKEYNIYLNYTKSLKLAIQVISKYRSTEGKNFSYKNLFFYILNNPELSKLENIYELFSFLLINELGVYESDHDNNMKNCNIFGIDQSFNIYKYCMKIAENKYSRIRERLNENWRR